MESIEDNKNFDPAKGHDERSTGSDIMHRSECLRKGDLENPHPLEFIDSGSEYDYEVIHQNEPLNVDNESEQVPAPQPTPVVENPPPQPPPTAPAGRGRGTKRKHPEAFPPPVYYPFPPPWMYQQPFPSGGAAAAPLEEDDWLPLGQKTDHPVEPFSGRVGIDYGSTFGLGPAQRKQIEADRYTALYWFRRFFDDECVKRVIEQTNKYVGELNQRERPTNLRKGAFWPPQWVKEWKPFTEEEFWKFLATLLWVAQHKTSNEVELFSEHWFYRRPAKRNFLKYRRFQILKAAIHFQSDDEDRNVYYLEQPVLRKIGILMERIRGNCMDTYSPGENLAFDEITIAMSSPSKYRKITKHKKKHESIQFWALGESKDGLQYCWTFSIDSPDDPVGKIQRAVIRHVEELPIKTGHRIYMDNLFTSVETFDKIRESGHYACGTVRSGRGGSRAIDAIKTDSNHKPNAAARQAGVTEQGKWVFSQHRRQGLYHYAWFDSGICHFLSNIEPPDATVVHRRKKKTPGKIEVQAPSCAHKYNVNMGAVDDIDHVREALTTRCRVYKWYWAVFYFLLDTCLTNAFTTWCMHTGDPKRNRRMWMVQLCEDMLALADGGTEGGHLFNEPPDQTDKTGDAKTDVQRCLDPTDIMHAQRLTQRHFLGTTGDNSQRRNCVVCYKTSPCKQGEQRVQTFCKQCGLYMHLDCFEQWHTVPDPLSPKFADVLALTSGLLK